MEQKNEILKKLMEFCDENIEHEYEHVLLAVKKAFNLGVQMSADIAKTKLEIPIEEGCRMFTEAYDIVDKNSILKLKI